MINRPRGLSKPELKLGKGWPRTFNNAVQELSIVAQTLEEFVLGRRRIQRKREREKKDSSRSSREGNLEVQTCLS